MKSDIDCRHCRLIQESKLLAPKWSSYFACFDSTAQVIQVLPIILDLWIQHSPRWILNDGYIIRINVITQSQDLPKMIVYPLLQNQNYKGHNSIDVSWNTKLYYINLYISLTSIALRSTSSEYIQNVWELTSIENRFLKYSAQ